MYGFPIPEDFILGTANSAFQSEGACDRDGISENMMEYFACEFAGKYRPGFTEEQMKAECGRGLGCGTAVVDEYMSVGCGVCSQLCAFDAFESTGEEA